MKKSIIELVAEAIWDIGDVIERGGFGWRCIEINRETGVAKFQGPTARELIEAFEAQNPGLLEKLGKV